jgi:hypothetical protein
MFGRKILTRANIGNSLVPGEWWNINEAGTILRILEASYTAVAPPADGRPYIIGFNVNLQTMDGQNITFVMYAGETLEFPFRNVGIQLIEITAGTLVGVSLEIMDIPIALDKEHRRVRPAAGFGQGQYGQRVVTGPRMGSQVNISGTGLLAGTTPIITNATVGNRSFFMTHLELANTAAAGNVGTIQIQEITTALIRATSVVPPREHDDNDYSGDPICFAPGLGVQIVIAALAGAPSIDYTLTGFYEANQ